ncbi:hypothetical protein SCLCIDRAFT_1216595 [Scleroderma citrinum Foug A]|uniref:Uncharacterized protein n=1 Tax=Scleroderma citrinum Foug A TaxID=1036808 RepID=A0A0C3A793_9AGAM|nr:hypothetical protein SCLCIDRAFT_1216595 [Scleroderma citrinum Foug A]
MASSAPKSFESSRLASWDGVNANGPLSIAVSGKGVTPSTLPTPGLHDSEGILGEGFCSDPLWIKPGKRLQDLKYWEAQCPMVVGRATVSLGVGSLPRGPLPSRLLLFMHDPRRGLPPTTARLEGRRRKDANPADRVRDGGMSPLSSLPGYSIEAGVGWLSLDWRRKDARRKCDGVCVTTSSSGLQLKDRFVVVSSFLGVVVT